MGWFRSATGRARKFAAVDRQTRFLIVRAISLLWFVRIGLCVASLRTVRSVLQRFGRQNPTVRPRYSAGQISELVARCAEYVPGANCLPQALTANVLLRREGHEPVLKIGVARGAQGEFQAHAWVEVQGESYSSDNETIGRFTALPAAFG
jgi:hypothetical protein